MFGLLLRPVFLDHQHQEQWVRESGLDWTIVRPSAFTNDAADGSIGWTFQPAKAASNSKFPALTLRTS